MVSLKTTSCSTLCQFSRGLAVLEGSKEQAGWGLGKDGKKTDHPSPATSYPVNISLDCNLLARTTPSGTDRHYLVPLES